MKTTEKLCSWDTGLYADCVEFCPFEPFLNLCVCGTYQLCESTSERVGRLSVHSVRHNVSDLSPLQTIESPGILDLKWCKKNFNDGSIVLASVDAKAQLVLYKLNDEGSLESMHRESVGSDCLLLSCDWFGHEKLAVSDSKGSITCLDVDGSEARVVSSFKAHDFESWVCCYDMHNSDIVYSGGDDSCFRLWDLRTDCSRAQLTSRIHQMGVTSIQTHCWDQFLLSTGSYDENLLLWDKRAMKRPVKEAALGGGVWKLKWRPSESQSHHLLVAAMHGGFHIVDTLVDDPVKMVSYLEHSSLAYGCDWSRSDPIVASCSFYDHSLQVWTWHD